MFCYYILYVTMQYKLLIVEFFASQSPESKSIPIKESIVNKWNW